MSTFLKYVESDIAFEVNSGDFITFYGEKNRDIVNNLMFNNNNNFVYVEEEAISKKNVDILRNSVRFVSIDYIDIFNSETIMDELAFPLENLAIDKKSMKERVESVSLRFNFKKINTTSPSSLDISTKAMLGIASALITEPKVLVLDNVLCLLDNDDKCLIREILKNYVSEGNMVINFTNDIEEALLGNKVIVCSKEKVLISGETISVLNEEKIMKRLGYSLPFKVLLSKYLKDYQLIDRYYLDYKDLGGALWK